MTIQRIAFVAVLFGFSIVLSSCEQSSPKAKKKKEADPSVAEAVDAPLPPAAPTGGDKSDPLGGEPDLPATPGGKTAPSEPTKVEPGTKVPKLPKFTVDAPTTPKAGGEAGEPIEHVQKPLAIPKAGMEAPTPKPQIVTLTYIGGTGNQWIQEVGFMEDGRIFAKSGGGTFTVYYSADGTKKLEVEGDISKPCTGNRGPNLKTWGGGAYRASCPTSKVKLEIGSHSYGVTKAQPYLKSTSHDWKWWGWTLDDMGKGMEAGARGVNVHFLQDDRFLATAHGDAANTTLAKDPRKLKDANPALVTALLTNPAGPGTLYMVGNGKNGTPVVGTFIKGKALAETVDPWERVYIGLPWSGNNITDTFKIGGVSGFCILNQNLTTCLFSSTLGADNIFSMALKDNILVLGGNIGQAFTPDPKVTPKNIAPAKLPVKNPAQSVPGGEEDGFLAIIKLW
jgi:hypothetical protein